MDVSVMLANKLENAAIRIKKNIRKKALDRFLSEYSLIDGKAKKKEDIRYNPYEGTNLLLVEELIHSGEITINDKILDIGCGAGLVLLYLASKGFNRLQGIEMDEDLFNLCKCNVKNYFAKSKKASQIIDIIHGNAVEIDVDDDVTCFYLFNTFYDEATYLSWLNKVKQSLDRRRRPIKIIILFPTVASMGAMRACSWLTERCRVICKSQVCYRCVHYLIYESVI